MASKRKPDETRNIDVNEMEAPPGPDLAASIEIPIGPDGTPQLESLPAETIGRLTEALGAGLSPPPAPVPPETVAFLISGLLSIEAAIIAPRYDLTREEIRSLFTPEGELRTALQEAGGRLLTKYAGPLANYSDEMTLAFSLVAWQTAAFTALRTEAARQAQVASAPATEQ